MKSSLTRSALAASCSVFLCLSAGADTITLFEGTFSDTMWQLVPNPYGPNGGGGTATQIMVGGNGPELGGGPARDIVNSCGPSNSGSYNASIYHGYSFDPGTQGQITGIKVSFDARFISGICAVGGAIEQGGQIWFFGYEINGTGWTTLDSEMSEGLYQITPSGTSTSLLPDFSLTGTPIKFGFWTGNGSGNGNGYSTEGVYDNFHAMIEYTPLPCPADLNLDAIVDGADLGILLGQWNAAGTADLNADGIVDGADLGALLGAWGPC